MPRTTPEPVAVTELSPTWHERPNRRARFWDRLARRYAADPIEDMAGYEKTLERVRDCLDVRQNVLEIGCGTGTTAMHLAPCTKRLLATDFSAEMIAIAREKLAAQPVPQLSFALVDADALPFEDGAFDTVLAFSVLHLVNDLDAAVAQVARLLRPGGLFISKTPCVSEMNPIIPWIALPLMRAVGKAPHVLCFTGDTLTAAVVRQGLELVSVERHASRGKDVRAFIVARKPVTAPVGPDRADAGPPAR